MSKAVIVGVVAAVIITVLVGGGIYLASRNEPAKDRPTPGGTIALDMDSDQVLDQQQSDQPILEGYTPVGTVDELQIIDLKTGTGKTVEQGATITAHYTGAIAANGKIFQSSKTFGDGKPLQFSLDGVIPGWTQGVPGMKIGGIRRLIIPAELAYGANPPSGIPANAALVFDIELVSIP